MFVFGIFFIALGLKKSDGETGNQNQASPTEFRHNGVTLHHEKIVTLDMQQTKELIPSPILTTPEVGDQGNEAALKEKDEMESVKKRKKKVSWLKNKTKKKLFFLGEKKRWFSWIGYSFP